MKNNGASSQETHKFTVITKDGIECTVLMRDEEAFVLAIRAEEDGQGHTVFEHTQFESRYFLEQLSEKIKQWPTVSEDQLAIYLALESIFKTEKAKANWPHLNNLFNQWQIEEGIRVCEAELDKTMPSDAVKKRSSTLSL